MDKLKLFISNFLIYGLGSIAGKIIPFIMLPIITRLMPDTKYFGLNELVVTFVSFGSAMAIMGMYDAVFRMFFDRDDDDFKKSICSTAFCFTICTSTLIFVLSLLLTDWLSIAVFGSRDYEVLVYISAISVLIGSTNCILSIPTRAQNHRKVFVLLNIATAIVSYSLSVPLLLKEHYLIALPLAGVFASLTNGIAFLYLNRKWFDYKFFDYRKLKEMLSIAIPLVPVFLIYWIFSSTDRLVVSKVLGNGILGIYTIGAKVASVSQLIYVAFGGGWQYFAFSTMNDVRQVENNSKIYEYLGVVSFIAFGIFSCFCKPVFDYFFTGDYVHGYVIAPILFLGPLLLMLYQIASNQFLVIKKTWPSLLILILAGLINVSFNYLAVPVLGIVGAALANLMGYTIANILCIIVLLKMKLMIISARFVFLSVFVSAYVATWYIFLEYHQIYSTVFMIVLLVVSSLCYRNELMYIISILLHKIKKE